MHLCDFEARVLDDTVALFMFRLGIVCSVLEVVLKESVPVSNITRHLGLNAPNPDAIGSTLIGPMCPNPDRQAFYTTS